MQPMRGRLRLANRLVVVSLAALSGAGMAGLLAGCQRKEAGVDAVPAGSGHRVPAAPKPADGVSC